MATFTEQQVRDFETRQLMSKRKKLGLGDIDALILRDEHGKATHIVYPPPAKPKTRIRRTREEAMNKTEREYWGKMQAAWKSDPTYRIFIAPIQLDLASGCTYRPDFLLAAMSGDLTFFEVKGEFIREDSWVKLKMAATQYPMFTFVKAQKKNGVWTETTVPRL